MRTHSVLFRRRRSSSRQHGPSVCRSVCRLTHIHKPQHHAHTFRALAYKTIALTKLTGAPTACACCAAALASPAAAAAAHNKQAGRHARTHASIQSVHSTTSFWGFVRMFCIAYTASRRRRRRVRLYARAATNSSSAQSLSAFVAVVRSCACARAARRRRRRCNNVFRVPAPNLASSKFS